MADKPMARRLCLLVFLSLVHSPAWAQTATTTLTFEVEIVPTFAIEATPRDAEEAEALQTVDVFVRTNRGIPYRIRQQAQEPFTNEDGLVFPADQIKMVVSDGDQGGRSQIREAQPLTFTPYVIFTSNVQGAADHFTVSFVTATQQLIPAGTFRARLTFEEELQ